LDLNAFAPPPTAPRPRPAEVRSWDRAAQQREATLNSPGLRKIGALAKMFPGAEKVRVRRQLQDGDWGPIGEWPMRTISASGDAESFIMTHVRPRWGGGRYQISVFDSANRETNAGEVILPEPIGAEPRWNFTKFILDRSGTAQVVTVQGEGAEAFLAARGWPIPGPIYVAKGPEGQDVPGYAWVEADGVAAACGGWSRRITAYGGDHTPGRRPALSSKSAIRSFAQLLWMSPAMTSGFASGRRPRAVSTRRRFIS
jgi:hypothetical protein